MQKTTRKYECSVRFGRPHKDNPIKWVSGAKYVGDSVVITFSSKPVTISYDLAVHASELLLLADHRPKKQFLVRYSTVDEVDYVSAPSEEVSGDE